MSLRLAPIPIGRFVGIARDTFRSWRHTASLIAGTSDSHPPRAAPAPADGSPHLLLLARVLPPDLTGGIYRPTALMKAATRRGWRVTAVAQPAPPNPTPAGLELFHSIPSSVEIRHFEPPPPGDASHYFAPRLSGGFDTIGAIVRAARDACPSGPPSMVMASGPPFSEFVAALVLSQRWRIPLILDYRDEWTQCPFRFVGVGNVDWFWERRCLRRAARVFFTTESQRQHQLRSFPQLDADRARVAPNGAHESQALSRSTRSDPEVPSIAYLGLLGEHCDLPEFLHTLEQALALDRTLAERVRLVFVGRKHPDERAALERFSAPQMLQVIDQVPLSEAQSIMRAATALLLFNPPRLARYLPGKAYDYIVTRRRIVLYGEGGELERLLAEYPPALRVNRGHAEALRALLDRIASGLDPEGPPVSAEFLDRCDRDRCAERQVVDLEELLPSRTIGAAVA